ncbi:MAG: sulfite exporter TauE/SafE family protein [Crocinitomicaceae bacterium]
MIWSGMILGFLGSWHCIGMCGPIALMIPGSRGKNQAVAIGLYHLGKILSYVLIGSFFGLFTVFLNSLKIQAIITLSAGVLIGVMAFLPFLLNWIEKRGFKLFRGVVHLKSEIGKSISSNRLEYGLYIGFLNGFIPCGLVYIAAIGAMVQDSFIESILYMVLFGIGTLPLMSAFQWVAGSLKNRFRLFGRRMRTAGFLLVSLFMIWKGVSSYKTQMEQPKEGEDFKVCAILYPKTSSTAFQKL